MNEHLEEPIMIDVSMEEPEEAGANARSPRPEYNDSVEAQVLMEEADEAGVSARARRPEYRAPGLRSPSQEPRARSQVHKSYYTAEYEPKQVNKVSNMAQVTEGRRARRRAPR